MSQMRRQVLNLCRKHGVGSTASSLSRGRCLVGCVGWRVRAGRWPAL